MTPIRSVAVFALLLVVTAVHFPIAEARDENSFKTTHYLFEPARLLPGQNLRICVADAAQVATDKQSLYFPEDMLAEIHLYEAIDGTALVERMEKQFGPGSLGVCFDIEGAGLGPPGGAPPEAVLAELIVSAPAESKAVPIATLELRDAASDTISALLLPAVQADAPVTPGRFVKYRPQFYFRTTDVTGAPTHIFGPFTLTTGQEVEICAADAGKVPDNNIYLDFIDWTAEVHAIGGTAPPLIIVAEDIEGEPLGVCFEDIDLTELALGGPDGTQPESVGLLILLYASAPPGSQVVPMATGRLKPIIFDEPEPVPLLLPAVQAAREAR